jgi:adenine-specific DNA-methyltransferase
VADHEYSKPGTYKIFVKIIDIFGIDTSQVYEIKVK